MIVGPPLARLRAAAAETGTAFAAAGGADGVNVALLSYAFSTLPGDCWAAPDAELVLVVTPQTVLVHCSAAAWEAGVGGALEDEADGVEDILDVEAYVPPPGASTEEAADFKLESLRAMLERAATEAVRVLAGGQQLLPRSPDSEEACAGWPLLQIATSNAPPLPLPTGGARMPVDVSAARRLLRRAMRSVDAAALTPGGWVGSRVDTVAAGWRGWLGRVAKAGDAYDRQEMSEQGLVDATLKAMAKALTEADIAAAAASKAGTLVTVMATPASTAPPTSVAAPAVLSLSADGTGTGVWAGTGTAGFGRQPARRRPLRMCGAASVPALHLIVRLADPRGSGLSATRTVFLSNGRLPHHWQHRIFSDGEVFDPIVEDAVSAPWMAPRSVLCVPTIAPTIARGRGRLWWPRVAALSATWIAPFESPLLEAAGTRRGSCQGDAASDALVRPDRSRGRRGRGRARHGRARLAERRRASASRAYATSGGGGNC